LKVYNVNNLGGARISSNEKIDSSSGDGCTGRNRTGASSAAHAAVFFSPAGTAVMYSFVPLVSGSPPVPLILI
jgi:hypothetical protein